MSTSTLSPVTAARCALTLATFNADVRRVAVEHQTATACGVAAAHALRIADSEPLPLCDAPPLTIDAILDVAAADWMEVYDAACDPEQCNYSPIEDGHPCADCGRPVWYESTRQTWYHMTPGSCFAASYRPYRSGPTDAEIISDALNAAVAVVQEKLGQQHGDFASHHFDSGFNGMADILERYVKAERAHLADD